MKILVTGSNGFLIRNMATCFTGHETCFIVRKIINSDIKRSSGIKSSLIKEVDIRNFDSLKRIIEDFSPDVILHAAAKISIKQCDMEDREMYETNVEGTRNIMKLAPCGCTVIYTSSMTVYSEKNPIPVTEEAVCVPLHYYGFTKLIGEEMVRYYGNCRNIDYLILRLPGLYGGDRDDGYIYNLIRKVLKNDDIVLDTTGLIYWQTISVSEINKIFDYFFKIVANESIQGTFNVCHCEDTDFIDTAYHIVKFLNSSSKVIVKHPIGYRKFQLSNAKLISALSKDSTTPYYKSLEQYVEAQMK